MSLGVCKICGGPYNDCESCNEAEKAQAIRDAVGADRKQEGSRADALTMATVYIGDLKNQLHRAKRLEAEARKAAFREFDGMDLIDHSEECKTQTRIAVCNCGLAELVRDCAEETNAT